MLTATVLPSLKEVREVNPEGKRPHLGLYIEYRDSLDKYHTAFHKWQQAEQSLRTWEIDEESLKIGNIFPWLNGEAVKQLTAGQTVTGEIRNGKFWIC